MTVPAAQKQDTRAAASLWILLVGNFLIGTGVLMPTGMLAEVAASFRVNTTIAAQLLTVSGIVIGIGAPLLAYATDRIDRRALLTLCMAVYAAGHLASVFAPNITALLTIRALTVTAAAVFSPQAAATVALVVPPERRESGVAFIFTGWAMAVVLGVPMAGFAAAELGSNAVYLGMTALCGLWGVITWSVLAPSMVVPRLDLSAARSVITHPQLVAVLIVTMLSAAGQFVVFCVLSPLLRDGFGAAPEQVPFAFIIAGIAGIVGNILATRLVGRFGNDASSAASILSLGLGLAAFALAFGNFSASLVAIFIWGLGSFSVTSLQQSRLMRVAPALASVTIALNTSVLYLGQAIGAVTGSLAIQSGTTPVVVWLALPFVCSAFLLSLAIPYLNRSAADRPDRETSGHNKV